MNLYVQRIQEINRVAMQLPMSCQMLLRQLGGFGGVGGGGSGGTTCMGGVCCDGTGCY